MALPFNEATTDIFLVAGQSNAEGKLANPQSWTHPTRSAWVFRQDGEWKDLDETVLSANDSANGYTTSPTDSHPNLQTQNNYPASGLAHSVWPLLATYIMAYTGRDVAFITTARGSSNLDEDWQSTGDDYAECLRVVGLSGVSKITAILWYQGESNVYGGHDYAALLPTFYADLTSDLSLYPPLIMAQVGWRADWATNSIDTLRAAQAALWAADNEFYYGPLTYDNEFTEDEIHWETDVEAALLAARWWDAVKRVIYDTSTPLPPIVQSIAQTGDSEIKVTFDADDAPLTVGSVTGWRVTDTSDDSDVVVSAAVLDGSNAVKLTLATAYSPSFVVSYGSNIDASQVGGGDLLDASGRPPVPFYAQSALSRSVGWGYW